MYVLQSSQGQLSGFQDLIKLLNFSRLSQCFRLLGNISFHTMGPKFLKDLSPLFTVFTFGRKNELPDLVFFINFTENFLHKWWWQIMLHFKHFNGYLVDIPVMKTQGLVLYQKLLKRRWIILVDKPKSSFMYVVYLVIHCVRAKHPN